jgi:prepilin-type N-terminal cleavage/methylation domain-containing protein
MTQRGVERSTAPARPAGFTLIETMAVVAILALLVATFAPSLGALSGRRLQGAADALAARLEFARQRTVMTGIPHRVWIDLDGAVYRLEWFVTEAEERGEEAPLESEPLDLRGQTPLPLEAPRGETASFRPLPGPLGRDEVLEESLAFRGIETPEGWIGEGEAAIEFAPDGTAEYGSVVLDDESGRSLAVEVLPLAEAVRVTDAET